MELMEPRASAGCLSILSDRARDDFSGRAPEKGVCS